VIVERLEVPSILCEVKMSRRNGDRARADRKHNEKIHKITYIRELRKRLEITGAEEGITEGFVPPTSRSGSLIIK
jgi:hypothetical protein